MITITYNGVFHMTENKHGTHVSGSTAGRFVADPVEAGLPNYTGRFSQHFTEKVKRSGENGTFTFSVVGRAVDGSGRVRFHEVAHFTINKQGPRVEFDKMTCG